MVVPFMLFPALMFYVCIRRALRPSVRLDSAGLPPDIRGADPVSRTSAADVVLDQDGAAPVTEGPKAGPEPPSLQTASVEVARSDAPKIRLLMAVVVVVIVLWLVPSLVFRAQAFSIAFLWITAISIVAPFAADRPTHFGRAALVATAVWFAALFGLSAAAVVISGRDPGDDAMVLLFPVMLFPGLMLLVIAVRVLRHFARRLRS